jgi:anionic cell wall polymer biosynthesis LytR-Cps2A-Psr (LCP) family protein
MSSGKHRRPEADPLPDVDIAERLAAGQSGSGTRTTASVASSPASPTVPGQSGRHETRAAPPVPPAPPGAGPASAAAAPGPTVIARQSRAEQRSARRRAARQRIVVVAGGLVGIALVAVGIWLLLRGDGSTGTVAADTPPTQHTTLLQLTGADGTASATALVGTTAADHTAAAVLVPSRLIVDVAGSGDVPFGETTTLGDPSAPAAALTDLLGVRVEDTWTLTPDGLAKLVDAVGGVQAAVDVDVVTTDAQGNQTVVVKAGNQLLKGPAAAAYAGYLADGEPEQARLARFDEVLTGLAEKLPADKAGVTTALTAAGAGSTSTLDPVELAGRLTVLRSAATKDALVSDVLPVTELDTGGTDVSYGLDTGQAAAMMRTRFPGALQQANGETVRVLVENGVGTPGLTVKARVKLVDKGFRFINGGNASPFNDDPSSIQVPDGTDKSIARGREVAAALGLPASSVVPVDRGQTVADVIVILGKDFKP